MVDYLLEQPGETEHTINPFVGETNDSIVNDMWAKPVQANHVREALTSASSGPVKEGSVGAGTGTQTYHWKGGIGTSSRVLPEPLGGYTVGVLVQSNLLAGATLSMNGAPIGRELGKYAYKKELEQNQRNHEKVRGGSIMIIVATDAPLSALQLSRVARRVPMGLAALGGGFENTSGDIFLAFSTGNDNDSVNNFGINTVRELNDVLLDPIYRATADATEEAIFNAMIAAETMVGINGNTLFALPHDQLIEVLRRYGRIKEEKK